MNRPQYVKCLFLLCIIICGLYYFLHWNIDDCRLFEKFDEENKNKNHTKVNETTKIILFWTRFFGAPYSLDGLKMCPELNCVLTNRRSYLNQSSAIIFHANAKDFKPRYLPRFRYHWQRYVFQSMESPVYTTKVNLTAMASFFNWTMTYRLDSDIPWTYGRFVKSNDSKLISTSLNETKILGVNKKLVVWLVSNCHTRSQREIYVRKLREYIPVDIFGECPMANFTCPKSTFDKCNEMIGENYKFYLAFENSVCTDYVTEKFFARTHLNLIPIVLNRKIAEKIMPNNSFIAADDFTSPKHLAQYLVTLSQNDKQYLNFFQWKTLGYTLNHQYHGHYDEFCLLCEKLWNQSEGRSIYSDIKSWWNDGQCETRILEKLLG